MSVLADIFLWLAVLATPAGAASPFVFQARHRTSGKIVTAFIVACWLSAGLACLAVWLS